MKRKSVLVFLFVLMFTSNVFAQTKVYTVKRGDTMWKIAVKHQIGISEIISANPQIKNPALIYPGQKINIPSIDDVKAQENEVIRLVNVERAKKGLPALKANWQLSRLPDTNPKTWWTRVIFHTLPLLTVLPLE